MNLNSIGSTSLPSLYGSSAVTPVQTTSADGGEVDASEPVGHARHHGHGGGRMENDLTSALASLGLSVPSGAATAAPTATADTSASSGSGSEADGGLSIETDLKQFMRALAESVRGASSTAGAGAGAVASAGTGSSGNAGSTATGTDGVDSAIGGIAAGGRRGNVQSGLSALISQVAGGNAPQGLQDAFSKLVTDLTAARGSAAATGSTSAGAAGSTADGGTSSTTSTATAAGSTAGSGGSVTLQALLTQLQQNIGYGRTSGHAVGNLVSTQA